MFIEQPPWFYRALFPGVTWRIPAEKKCVYLTFDDGPIPEVTPWVLDILDTYGIKATFFMVGDNVRKHPEVFQMVIDRGHRVGNHTFNHIQGIKFWTKNYLANVEKAAEYIPSNLFRPPHGHMRFPNTLDFSAEYPMFLINRKLYDKIETVYLAADEEHLALSSTNVKEVAVFGGDISFMVPAEIKPFIIEKYQK